MTEQDKVTVDDIIGIVKTEEQTNSVALKKEAQLSICEKRLIELEKENEQLKTVINRYEKYSNKKNDELNFRQLDILKLKEENEQLKELIKEKCPLCGCDLAHYYKVNGKLEDLE